MISSDASRYHVIHHLADVYCELHSPLMAEKLVMAEFAKVKEHSKPFRRLALPLTEAYIMLGKHDEAERILGDLLVNYGSMDNPDVSDQLGHVRCLIGLARISWHNKQWAKACEGLDYALFFINKYDTFVKEGFYAGVVHIFLSIMYRYLEKDLESQASMRRATSYLQKQRPQHFIPGIGSYVLCELKLCSGYAG